MICLIIIISIFAHLTKKRKEEKKDEAKKKTSRNTCFTWFEYVRYVLMRKWST